MRNNKRKIVLASQSPRRKQLLEQMGLQDFEIKESCYKKNMQDRDDPRELLRLLSLSKAKEMMQLLFDSILKIKTILKLI